MNNRYARRTISFAFAAALAAHAAAAKPAATVSTSADCSRVSGVLRLYVINEASASRQTLATAMLETSAIWATAGLHLTWTFPPAPVDFTDTAIVVVLVQRGLERPPTLTGVSSKRPAMPLLGRVPFGEHGPGNLIQISFEAITSLVMGSSYMSTPIAKLPDFLQQVLLGRGLGRVVAHEIGHWLVGRGHMREGLMRPAFYPGDLVEGNRPRLPRAWTVRLAPSTRCDPTARGD